jgi:hypothetical protein
MPTPKEAVKKPATRRVEVFTRKHCDNIGKMHNVGDICTLTDEDELALLTEREALKTTVIKG